MRPLISCIAVMMIVTAPFRDGECSEYLIEPSLAVSEEYNDNIYLDPVFEVHDYITHLVPAIRVEYAAPFWDWKISYLYDYRYYAHHGYENDSAPELKLVNTTRLVTDLLFVDVRDTYGRTSTTPVRDYTQESLVKNLTDYNALDVNPYLGLRLSSTMTFTAGYQYRNVTYRDPVAIDRIVHSVYGDLARGVSDRTSLTASARSDRTETAQNSRTRARGMLGARYEYRETSYLWGGVGTTTTFDEADRRETEPVWDAGITHRMTALTLTAETGRMFIEDPLLIDRREDRYVAGFRVTKDRTAGGLSVGLRNYGERRTVDERKYSVAADFGHFLTEQLQAKYAVTMDRYNRFPANAADTMTIVYGTDVRFDYHATESFVVSLSYRHTDSYSAAVYLDNYDINRVFVEAKMTF